MVCLRKEHYGAAFCVSVAVMTCFGATARAAAEGPAHVQLHRHVVAGLNGQLPQSHDDLPGARLGSTCSIRRDGGDSIAVRIRTPGACVLVPLPSCETNPAGVRLRHDLSPFVTPAPYWD